MKYDNNDKLRDLIIMGQRHNVLEQLIKQVKGLAWHNVMTHLRHPITDQVEYQVNNYVYNRIREDHE